MRQIILYTLVPQPLCMLLNAFVNFAGLTNSCYYTILNIFSSFDVTKNNPTLYLTRALAGKKLYRYVGRQDK